MQLWPALSPLPQARRLAVVAMSASASTIAGFLPPSSRVTGVRWRAAAASTNRPTRPPPVKKMWSNCCSIRAAATAPSPLTTCTTSAEKACGMERASSSAVLGACSDGLSTAVLPAARALTSGCRQSLKG